jgi:Lon protease-like protein
MYELPIFPLNTVLFPGMPLRLHIFEERYRIMIQRIMQTNQTFGVNMIHSGLESHGPLAVPYPTGCTARIIQVEPLEDGRYNLTAIGDERYRILRVGTGQPYMTAFVEAAPLAAHHTIDVIRGARGLRTDVSTYLQTLKVLSEKAMGDGEEHDAPPFDFDLSALQLPDDPMMMIYLAASLLQVPALEKQPLLEADTAALLLEQLRRLYRRENAILPPLIDTDDDQARLSAWVN